MSRRLAIPLIIGIILSHMSAAPLWAAAPAGEWWDISYPFRQKITVTTGAAPPVNRYNGYSVARTLDTAALIASSKMQADCDDLRTLWWNGSAWLELDRDIINCNTVSTQVWFKLQADIANSASDDNYYFYYGNAGVAAGPSNRNNVYLYFDNFESYAVGTVPTGWSVLVGNASIQNDGPGNKSLRMDSATAGSRINLRRDITPSEADILVEADCKFDASATANRYCGTGARWSGTGAANETGYMGDVRYNANASVTQKYLAGAWTGIGTLAEAVSLNTVYRVRLTLFGSTLKMYRDGVLKLTNTDTSIAGANMLGIDAYNGSTGAYEFLDNYLARRYAEPEPTAGAAAEESNLAVVKRAFTPAGAAIPDAATVAVGTQIKFMLYVTNPGSARTDVSIRDVLPGNFVYQAGTIKVVNPAGACALMTCTAAEEATMFTNADPSVALTDAVDADTASFASATVDAGNQFVGNGQLDIASNSRLVIVLTALVQ